MNLTQLARRARSSLFFIPTLFIIGSGLLAWVALELDRADFGTGLAFLLPTSISGARTVLATIAGATITVAGLVFSLTAVTVQLAASQYSPRVLSEFLSDRFQQVIVGVVVGTFTFSLVSLATIGEGAAGDTTGVTAAWATTIATGLAVATIIGIVAFIDRVTTRLNVDNTIRRISSETSREFAKLFTEERIPSEHGGDGWAIAPGAVSEPIKASATGWIQQIDTDAILAALRPGQIARVEARVGHHVVAGETVMTVWMPPGPGSDAVVSRGVGECIMIGDFRTVTEDPGFGLRQLIDIALRALSPGVNDPTTAGDVLRQLVVPLRIVLLGHPRSRVQHGPNGRLVALPEQRDRTAYVRAAFGEIRLAMERQPHVATAMASCLLALRKLSPPADGTDALDEQFTLLEDTVDRWGLSAIDRASLDRVLEAYREVVEAGRE